MRKKIIAMSVVVTILAMLCAQSVTAQVPGITVYALTDKPQYKPGETVTLKISMLNERDEPVEIHNITIRYPWFRYDAETGEWVGNETIKGDPLATMTSKGTETDHYYREVEFTVPTDGGVSGLILGGTISINVGTNKGYAPAGATLTVSSFSLPITIVDLNTWMTSLTVAVVVCTIILAIAVFLATRRAQAPRRVVPRAIAPPPPPKPKAKTG